MGKTGEQLVVIATAIIGVAVLAVIVSRSANTSNVIAAIGNALSGSLKAAITPITSSGMLGG